MPKSQSKAPSTAPSTAPSADLAAAPTPAEAAAARTRCHVALRDLDIAPENLRYGEGPDDDIPLLAETLLAAGQLQPLTVRPGRGRTERPHMALDGRRRLLALRHLLEEARIDEAFLVDIFVETDPARQAAAVLLTNIAVPVHVADVISAIGRMLKGKLGISAMARALGYAEIDVKRLAVLSGLPEDALIALRSGRLNLRQARLLARLTDPEEQAELARMVVDGHGFQEWRIKERLDQDRVTTRDPRWALVGPARYTEAGGRMETDLFGEMEPVLLDPPVLTRIWMQRAREIALALEEQGLAVHVAAGDPPILPEDLETLGYVYGGMLPADEMAAYRDLRDRFDVVSETVNEVLEVTTETEPVDQAVIAMIQARLAMDQAGWGGRQVTTLVLAPAARIGVAVQCYSPAIPESEDDTESDDEEAEPVSTMTSVHQASAYPAPDPEIDGVGHALHAMRTDVATRGLVRALAEDPEVAFTALIAHLFGQVASRPFGPRPQSALAINASAFRPKSGRVVEALDGEIRQRLDLRRADWEASGKTVIAWVHAMAQPDRMALMAELTALTLDLREERTSLIQRGARSQAAELADLCGADITRHWTPDADFLKPHARSHLLGMLEAMGARDAHAEGLKKSDLISRVETMAAEKVWAPASLSWRAPPMGDEQSAVGEGAGEETEAPDAPGGDETGAGDGAGAFEVTPDGAAALGVAA